MTLTGEKFRAVEAEGFDLDEDLASFGDGNGALFEFEDGGATCGVYDSCLHGSHDLGCEISGGRGEIPEHMYESLESQLE